MTAARRILCCPAVLFVFALAGCTSSSSPAATAVPTSHLTSVTSAQKQRAVRVALHSADVHTVVQRSSTTVTRVSLGSTGTVPNVSMVVVEVEVAPARPFPAGVHELRPLPEGQSPYPLDKGTQLGTGGLNHLIEHLTIFVNPANWSVWAIAPH